MGELGETGGQNVQETRDVQYFGLFGDTDEIRGTLIEHYLSVKRQTDFREIFLWADVQRDGLRLTWLFRTSQLV